ncbi:MAG TPA: response regulator [Candidatus Nitrosotalea sp.]|nr:response regulator [Candidatus Nitrosotalea sp.]
MKVSFLPGIRAAADPTLRSSAWFNGKQDGDLFQESPSSFSFARADRRGLKIGTQTILVSDDDPGVREMLRRVLESEHFHVVTALSGCEAARKLEAHTPDLVLLDSSEADGELVFDVIDRASAILPVIGIESERHQNRHLARRRFDALIEKPLNLPILLQVIRALLSESRTRSADPGSDGGIGTGFSIAQAETGQERIWP